MTPLDTGWTQVIIALIGLVNLVLVACLARWQSHSTAKVTDRIQEVHIATNGMKDALVLATEKAAMVAGRTSGLQEGKALRDDLRAEIDELKILVGVNTAKLTAALKKKIR